MLGSSGGAHEGRDRVRRTEDSVSRRKRFDVAVERARAAALDLRTSMDDLEGLKDEWQEWFDNMPENFQQGTLGAKLEECAELDLWMLESAADEVDSMVSTLEELELPRGFGRD